MRTIKFKGKSIDGKEWLYGDLVSSTDKKRFAILVNNKESYDECEVAPETIGQFSGLYDCNKKEIYEGDILRVNDSTNVVCEFRHGAFGYTYCNEFHPFVGNTNYTFNPKNTDKNFEVIGNIHDNTELLKGGKA